MALAHIMSPPVGGVIWLDGVVPHDRVQKPCVAVMLKAAHIVAPVVGHICV